ncbi:MAG: hypothetical protein ABSA75_15275, partial [Candidatus Bathyarchaeia archaeon]
LSEPSNPRCKSETTIIAKWPLPDIQLNHCGITAFCFVFSRRAGDYWRFSTCALLRRKTYELFKKL